MSVAAKRGCSPIDSSVVGKDGILFADDSAGKTKDCEDSIRVGNVGEAVVVREDADAVALVQLQERQWGPKAALPFDLLATAVPGWEHVGLRRVAIVRQPFAAYDEDNLPLSKVVVSITADVVAVSSMVAAPQHALVVDECLQDEESGSYMLQATGTDLLAYLHGCGVRVCLVPDVQAAAARKYNSVTAALTGRRQSTNEVLMVAPTAFGFNDQAAQDNYFMQNGSRASDATSTTRQVLNEFSRLHKMITRDAGVKVTLFEHGLQHQTPDAVFPNNWFSTHAAHEGGCLPQNSIVFYPMKCPNRSAERRQDIKDVLYGRACYEVIDMSHEEKSGDYFEGTGVLVLDRINGVAYVALSERASERLARQWAQQMGYELITFHSTDASGHAVYHTNVMLAIGTDVAVVCAESIDDATERAALLGKLGETRKVIEITREQMAALCGNVLELENDMGLPVLAMSSQAYKAFNDEQKAAMLQHVAALHHTPIPVLERIGGGGVRCCMAEIFFT